MSQDDTRAFALQVKELLIATGHYPIVEKLYEHLEWQTDMVKLRQLSRFAEDAARGQVARAKETTDGK